MLLRHKGNRSKSSALKRCISKNFWYNGQNCC